MTEGRGPVSIRVAQPEDGPTILAMLRDLASFEGAAHPPRLDTAALARDVFGPIPKLNILIAEQAAGNDRRQIVGFVSHFRNYSSWEGKPGIHIGDLWVSPEQRGQGVGSALLRHILSRNEGKQSTFLSSVTTRLASFTNGSDSKSKRVGASTGSKLMNSRRSPIGEYAGRPALCFC